MELNNFLLAFFQSEQYVPMRPKEIADLFGLVGDDRLSFYAVIDEMLDREEIRTSKRGKIKAYGAKNGQHVEEVEDVKAAFDVAYQAPVDEYIQRESDKTNEDTGVIQGNERGFAFYIPDNKEEEDVFIAAEDLNGALHGDRVRIQITLKGNKAKGLKSEGRVVQIVERNRDNIIGLFEKRKGYGFVLPDQKRYFKDIYIDQAHFNGAENQDKVVVKIHKYEKQHANPEGHIVEVLGNVNDAGVDITSVARRFDLPYAFSNETIKQVESLPSDISQEDLSQRQDFRKLFTVTIDGADAKDFDDAISVEKKEDHYILYVHIADVSHYVKKGTPIDRDAYKRGNSVYLLDRVIPMLPEELSNGLCSLLPGQDRLTMTSKLILNQKGDLVSYEFLPSVIQSNHRLIYDDVSDYMERGSKFSKDQDLYDHLDLMKEIYELLAEKRKARGSLDFEFPETKVELDRQGKVVTVGIEERRVANRVIEEFMILNNEAVGSFFKEKQWASIFRVHDYPDTEKIFRLNKALSAFSYPLVSESPSPQEISRVLSMAKGKKEEGVLNMLILQSMSRAIYDNKQGIHFGLASDHYSHFTAPIRRYADLIAHRLVKKYLVEAKDLGEQAKEKIKEMTIHLSDMEEKAEEAERDVVDMKCAEYMEKYVGQTFEGMVSSITNFGVFVILDNSIEGLCHFREMKDDYFTYDEDHFIARGEHTKKEIHYGDRVKVLVTKSNPMLREIDFLIYEEESELLRSGYLNGIKKPVKTTSTRGPVSVFMQPGDQKPISRKGPRRKGQSSHRNRLSNKSKRRRRK